MKEDTIALQLWNADEVVQVLGYRHIPLYMDDVPLTHLYIFTRPRVDGTTVLELPASKCPGVLWRTVVETAGDVPNAVITQEVLCEALTHGESETEGTAITVSVESPQRWTQHIFAGRNRNSNVARALADLHEALDLQATVLRKLCGSIARDSLCLPGSAIPRPAHPHHTWGHGVACDVNGTLSYVPHFETTLRGQLSHATPNLEDPRARCVAHVRTHADNTLSFWFARLEPHSWHHWCGLENVDPRLLRILTVQAHKSPSAALELCDRPPAIKPVCAKLPRTAAKVF
ncbi:ORF91 [Ranid herpesvirus 1]|uniref:ORF91 n=1 Tax=Ranid herpesvirus 1 TaxID=85655 RepID=Q14VN9_9VIRU|nr:ORF91 [Ranid herpesvirus 1]ABG25769.1 ORF91 [Ranid herpesvirus 1]